MKKNIIIFLMGILFGSMIYGLEINKTYQNALMYIKKIIFTDDGTPNGNSKVVINGSEGDISMSGVLKVYRDAVLPDGSINTNEIADGAVTSEKIKDGDINTVDIANGAVTSVKIKDGTINSEDMSENSIGAREIKEGDNYIMENLKINNILKVGGGTILTGKKDIYSSFNRLWYFLPDTCDGNRFSPYICKFGERKNCRDVIYRTFIRGYWYRTVNCFPEVLLDGDVNIINGDLKMNNNRITNVADPVYSNDVATKRYVDSKYVYVYYPGEKLEKEYYGGKAGIKEITKQIPLSYKVKVCIYADDAYLGTVKRYYGTTLIWEDTSNKGGKDEDGGWKTVCKEYVNPYNKIDKVVLKGGDAGGPDSFQLNIYYSPYIKQYLSP